MNRCGYYLSRPGQQIHRSAHSGNHLSGNHVVCQVSILINLKNTKNRVIKVPAPDDSTYRMMQVDVDKNIGIEDKNYMERKNNALLIGDAIDDGIYVINSEGIITDVNHKYCQLAGITREHCIGMPAEEITHEYFETKDTASLQVLRENRKITVITKANKTGKELLVTACLIRTDNGGTLQIVTVMRDIKELGKEVATPDEAREILALKNHNKR